MGDQVEELLALHRAFWARENARPLLQVSSGPRVEDLQQLREPLGEGPLDPGQLDPARLVRPFAAAVRPGSDFFQPLAPPNMSWTEGMIGCPVWVTAGESTWAAPVDAGSTMPAGLQLTADNPWQLSLLRVLRVMVDLSAGRLPVAQPMMRGPSDMAGALLGQSRMCTEIYLHLGELKQLLQQCAELWAQSYRQQLLAIPPWHGGYCNVYGVWSPGTAMRLQEDTAALFSPRHYEEFLLPLDRLIAEAAEYPVMHMHSDSLRFVDLILAAAEIKAVQVAVDIPPFGPTASELVPVLQKILASKPLILYAYDPLTLDQAQDLTGQLPSEGLALKINLVSEREAGAYRVWLGR